MLRRHLPRLHLFRLALPVLQACVRLHKPQSFRQMRPLESHLHPNTCVRTQSFRHMTQHSCRPVPVSGCASPNPSGTKRSQSAPLDGNLHRSLGAFISQTGNASVMYIHHFCQAVRAPVPSARHASTHLSSSLCQGFRAPVPLARRASTHLSWSRANDAGPLSTVYKPGRRMQCQQEKCMVFTTT